VIYHKVIAEELKAAFSTLCIELILYRVDGLGNNKFHVLNDIVFDAYGLSL